MATLTGTFTLLDGSPASGTVRVTPSRSPIVDVDGKIVISGSQTFPLDKDGKLAAQIPASDDPDLGPPFTYTIDANLTHASWKISKVWIPHGSTTVDLSEIGDYTPTPGAATRVVTIPADGEDGQVLVWDGAGFSWDFPPTGPKGDKGDTGTSDIVVDTSVGTRVFANGIMVHGDTGWRNIEHLLSTDWHQPTGADHFHIRREGTRIHLRLRIKRKTPGPRGNFTPILNTLNGFSPPTYATFGPANVATDIGVIANPTNITTIGVAYMPGTWVDGETLTASATWDTVQPWPNTLPGEPA